MHISLDSALGRQRRLNSVGESVLQIAPDAAAAYSLRSLTGGDPKVVRVRRASDNGERDFTSSDVTSGEMLRWVNTQAIKPLDIQALEADGRTGDFLIAKAAYALRSLGTRQATLAATGDTVARANDKFVAQVRRNVNGDLKSFTATEVSDGTLTSFVNESFTSSLPLDVSGSASAAYGLRNLSSTYSGDVVEVRRNVNGDLKSFTATEVTDGTLTSFVNESFTSSLPLDVSGSASAAYSLRNLSSTYSGNVVEVRRSSDDTTQNFTATEITDGTLLAFVGTGGSDNGHVKTWYDQSGNSRDATQATSSNQPKIVNAGVLVTDRDGKLALDGKSSQLDFPESEMLSSNGSYSLFTACDIADQTSGSVDFYDLFRFISDGNGGASSARKPQVFVRKSNGTLTSSSPSHSSGGVDFSASEAGSVQLMTSIQNPALSTGNNLIFSDGVLKDSTDASTSVNNEQTLDSSESSLFISTETSVSHFLSEVIYYPSDQSDKRRAIEESISGHYGITLGSFNRDGLVRTWYDQSGNSRDAVQATAASQPKIVDAGTLVERTISGTSSPSVQFTASNSMTHGLTSLSADGQQSLFFVADNQVTSNTSHRLIEIMSSTSDEADRRRPLIFQDSSSSLNFSVDNLSGFNRTTSQSNFVSLYSSITEDSGGGTHTAHQDGSQFGSASVTLNTNATIALSDRGLGELASDTAGAFFFTEIIYYPSNQTTKRRAIEESISGHYGITLGSFNRDGFVKTWYDQSVTTQAGDTATGNHAVQTTAASQPKIVDAGSFLNELDFDGTDDTLAIDFGADLSQANSIFMVHQSDTTTDTKNEFFDSSGSDSPRTLLDQAGSDYRMLGASSVDTGVAVTTNKSLVFALYNGASSLFAKDGTATSALNAGTADINQNSTLGSSATRFYDGSMQEFIIYNSDQTDNRTAIEANIGEAYSITGIPAYDDEVDGFVETWYDQSGNNRPLIQANASEQPLIVEAGTFLNGVKSNQATSNDTMQNLQVSTDGTNANFGTDDWASGASSKLGAVYVGTVPSASVVTSTQNSIIWGGSRGVGAFQEGGVSLAVVKAGTDSWRLRNERQGLSPSTMDCRVSLNTDADVVIYGTADNREFTLNVNGSGNTETESADLDVREDAPLSLFGAYDGSANRYYQRSSGGVCKECYLYAGDPVANIPALATSINEHYSIY